MKTKFKVSPLFVLMWTAIFFFDRDNLFLSLVASMAVHELSHLGMIKILGGNVDKIELSALGLVISCNGVVSYRDEILTAVAGPLGSLIFAVIAGKMGEYVLSGINMALFLFNSVPVMPLDGGRILGATIAWRFGKKVEEQVNFIALMVFFALLGVVGIYTRRVNLIYFAVILGICSCKNELNGVKFKAIP